MTNIYPGAPAACIVPAYDNLDSQISDSVYYLAPYSWGSQAFTSPLSLKGSQAESKQDPGSNLT